MVLELEFFLAKQGDLNILLESSLIELQFGNNKSISIKKVMPVQSVKKIFVGALMILRV